MKALSNPNPNYYVDRDTRAFIAIDNANGGATIPVTVVGPRQITPDQDGYLVRYNDPRPPYAAHEDTVPAETVFLDMDSVARARKDDKSLQEKDLLEICSTPEGLVRYLLENAALPEWNRRLAAHAAAALGLYGDLKHDKEQTT